VHYPTDLKVRYRYGDNNTVNRIVGWYGETGEKEKFVIAHNIKINPDTHQIDNLVFGNGIKSVYGYDTQGLTSKIALRKDGRLIDRRNYRYDDKRNVTSIGRLDTALTQNFAYDLAGRLTRERRGTNPAADATYHYDASGNRTHRDNNQKSTLYNYASGSNQLSSINGKRVTFDTRGNLVQDRNKNRLFVYDVTNRLSAFYKNGQLQASYNYNAFGQRIKKITQHPSAAGDYTKSRHFAYTPDGWLLSEIGRKSDNRKSFTHEYVWLGGVPLAKLSRRIKADGATQKAVLTYLHTDHLATPRRATNEAGQTIWLWESDAFGRGGVDKDPDGDGRKTAIRLRFPGQYADSESGLFYNHHRDYDPKLGRYIQSDPIGLWDGINRYAYVKSAPITGADPTGLSGFICTHSFLDDGTGNPVPGSVILEGCRQLFSGSNNEDGSSILGFRNRACGSSPCPEPPGDDGIEPNSNAVDKECIGLPNAVCISSGPVAGQSFDEEIDAVKAAACFMNRLSSTTFSRYAPALAPEFSTVISHMNNGFVVGPFISDNVITRVNPLSLVERTPNVVAVLHSHGNSRLSEGAHNGDAASYRGYRNIFGIETFYVVEPNGSVDSIETRNGQIGFVRDIAIVCKSNPAAD